MHVRVLFGAVEALKSRLLDRWTAGWSVPTDEVFVPARLPLRDAEAGGGIAEPWLRMAARSAAVKWRSEVCGVHRGRVRSVVIAGAGLPQPASNKVHGAVHVTARYCGRVPDGGFCFRHGLCDTNGSEVLHFVSQVYFNPPPDLPAYPALKFDVDDDSEALYQAAMRSTMAAAALSGGDFSESSAIAPIDTKQHAVASGVS
ncbi:hypothetical protein ASE61_05470 [Bosea sp. Root670]|uniref:hypothetical protein n=1 Tax=unclassified Bosea (in: a-proteobacteria) TaxID=2653178 RepID=UPI000713F15E|nr:MULTISPECIES: hypothetical protein [unclassified Bosea (in: a-proteobacteria)]KRE08984.1 hypothetical protein ASE61_05470 [Bosea sp. Root670]TQI75800.1 hypothetical protein FHT98_3586 [Bosea sp. AK1]